MSFESIREEIITIKKEQLEFVDKVNKTSIERKLTEKEMLDIYRKLYEYSNKLHDMAYELYEEMYDQGLNKKYDDEDIVIEFPVNKEFLTDYNLDQDYKDYVFSKLGVDGETYSYKLTFKRLLDSMNCLFRIPLSFIQNGQYFNHIYMYICTYDRLHQIVNPDSNTKNILVEAVYVDIYGEYYEPRYIHLGDKDEFESKYRILQKDEYTDSRSFRRVFNEELLNAENDTIDDCINSTIKKTQIMVNEEEQEVRKK